VSRPPVFIALLLLTLASAAPGQARLSVERGWGGVERTGRWNPLIVRVSNPVPIPATLELVGATGDGFATVIRERIAVGPTVSTYEVYAPAHYGPPGRSVVVLRDGRTDRTLAQFLPPSAATTRPSEMGPNGLLIGASGRTTLLEDVVRNGIASAGFLAPRFLPRSPIGFDAIDVLFLNEPDLGAIGPDQQRAILEWVRAGGSLLLAPGDGPLPGDAPLIPALPCRIGDVRTVEFSGEVLKQAGITDRSRQLAGRELIPADGSDVVEILRGSGVKGYARQFGLGRILVTPFSPVSVRFDPTSQPGGVRAFWEPMLASLVNLTPTQPKRKYDAPYYGYQSESEEQEREGTATSTLCDALVPPTGRPFQVPLVVLGILLVIGPVDSIVLFATGRRQWNWATVAGWLGMLAGGVAYAFLALRPATAEVATIRLIDQAGDHVVATTDLAGFGSSSGRRFVPQAGAEGFWQSAIPGTLLPQFVRPQPDAELHENDTRCSPEPQRIGPGAARFLRADSFTTGDPLIEASLRLTFGERATAHLVGVLKNVSTHSLTDLRIRTRFGVTRLPAGTLASGQTTDVDVAAAGESFSPDQIEGRYQNYGSFGSRHLQQPVQASDLWLLAADLSGRRSLRVDELIDRTGNFACIYAQVVDPPSPLPLAAEPAVPTRSQAWVRAVVPLGH